METNGWRREDSSGIDRALLQATDVPILFYDETLLYQDDLEDCGEISFDVKLRVMPSCWFVLSREFLRVDGALLRIRDTRLFHRFGDDRVHAELTWRDFAISPNPSSAERSDLDVNVNAIPQSLMRNPAALAERLPIVNDRENVHRFYSLQLHA
jgi:type 2A phosphatase activator TIP41